MITELHFDFIAKTIGFDRTLKVQLCQPKLVPFAHFNRLIAIALSFVNDK